MTTDSRFLVMILTLRSAFIAAAVDGLFVPGLHVMKAGTETLLQCIIKCGSQSEPSLTGDRTVTATALAVTTIQNTLISPTRSKECSSNNKQ